MAQKIVGYVKLQLPAGKANAGPPLSPAVAPYGISIINLVKEFNERTKNDVGFKIPIVITMYADRTYSFVTKTPPAAALIMKACNIESGSGVPNNNKVATITRDKIREIAEFKMKDLNAKDMEGAERMIAGTCRSMGVVVAD